jgi:hypothetical protein
MLTPINMADAQILGKTLDGAMHHQSVYFNQLIKTYTGQTIETFNFSLPGEMPSDAFLITKSLLCDSKKPEMIIYGVGPRDFMDNLLDSPTATDPYRYLLKSSDQQPDKLYFGNRWDQQLDYELASLIYVYGKKENLSAQLTRTYQNLVNKTFPPIPQQPQFIYQQRHSFCPNYQPMAIAAGESLFHPIVELGNRRFTDNLAEYKKRYGTLNWNTFLTQLQFLSKFLDLSRKQGIEAVVVAMPITTINRQLIPSFAWNTYRGSLRAIAMSKNARFLDLESSGQFNDGDFGDTVHLNTVGGIKLLQVLAESLGRGDTMRRPFEAGTFGRLAGSSSSALPRSKSLVRIIAVHSKCSVGACAVTCDARRNRIYNSGSKRSAEGGAKATAPTSGVPRNQLSTKSIPGSVL